MKKMMLLVTLGLLLATPMMLMATPADDVKTYREYFKKKFPSVPLAEYANGIYAVDPIMRANWEAIEEFPPYEPAIEAGEKMFKKPFANGKTYASCLPNGGMGIAQDYPKWDKKMGKVITLALAVNMCREANGEKPLKYKKGKIADLLAYMNYTSRGKLINIVVPKNDPRALAAYEDGKKFFFTRRGQLNFACSGCHMQAAGQLVRTNRLSPALGQATGWPVYRSKWGNLGTLHRRYGGCNKQVRAKPFKAQSPEYRNLEYFHVHMSNGIPINGPAARQ